MPGAMHQCPVYVLAGVNIDLVLHCADDCLVFECPLTGSDRRKMQDAGYRKVEENAAPKQVGARGAETWRRAH
jgi:hypothetical protein